MTEKVTAERQRLVSSNLENDSLLRNLLRVQRDIRDILTAYKIESGSLSAMARQARKQISNPEVRADFLELLITLQELGTLAKSRRILDEAEITVEGALSNAASRATERRHGLPSEVPEQVKQETHDAPVHANTRGVDRQASSDFFDSLDRKPD